MAKRRHRRHQLREQQTRHQKQIEAQLAKLGGAALSQPIFFIYGRRGPTVSRTLPGVLEGHMDDASWSSFCDRIDEALLPLGKIRKEQKMWCLLPLSIFVPLVLLGFAAHCLMTSQLTGPLYQGSKLDWLPVVLFSIAFAGSITWALLMARRSSRRKTEVNKVLARTCYETSTYYPGVSFKVYDDLRYIQVIVAKDAPPGAIVIDAAEGKSESIDGDSTASSSTASSDSPAEAVEAAEATKWRYAIDEESGRTYFFHEETHEVSWELPLDRFGSSEGKVADDLEVDA